MPSDASPSAALGSTARDLAREVLIHGPISRAELGRRLGLSPASLTRLSKPFLDRGVFIEGLERTDGAAGRPTKPLDVRVDARRFVGIKLTATHALAVATDLRADEVAGLDGVDIALKGSSIDAVVDAVREALGALGGVDTFAGLGVSIGGQVGPGGVVLRAPFLGWRDVPLGDALAEAIGMPVTIENDVVALTAAEHWFGLGRGLTDFAVLTVGAGVGYGLVMNDRVIAPPDAGLGLGGHYPLDQTGPECSEGHRGCSTAMLTIGGIEHAHLLATGGEASYEHILAGGDEVRDTIVARAGSALGLMIAAIANLTMVDDVVLSGEGIALFFAAETSVREAISHWRDPEAAPVELRIDDSGFSNWARGAAAAAIQNGLATLTL